MHYQLTITKNQMAVTIRALDLFSRMLMRQYDALVLNEDIGLPLCQLNALRKQTEQLGAIFGFGRGASYCIMSPEIPDSARVAYDIQQVARHLLAWERHPEGGHTVDFHEPHKTSHGVEGLPQAVIIKE